MTNRYPWISRQGIRIIGQAVADNIVLGTEQLADRISLVTGSFQAFKSLMNELNGPFSVIIPKEAEIWIHCSHTWSYPSFYHVSVQLVALGDDPEEIGRLLPQKEMNTEVKAYFWTFGVTPGADTLVRQISQVIPGETIRIDLKTKKAERFGHQISSFESNPSDEAEAAGILRRLFARYSGYLSGKKILLPLTRGYDSRLLACLLKESGHTRVTCATWGRMTGSERVTAEKVAKKLDFRHIFVPYPVRETSRWLQDDIFREYMDYAGHYSSMPYLQDYFAIRSLKESGVIDEDTWVLPGHPGDFLRGAHLWPSLPFETPGEIAGKIISLFGTSLRLTKTEAQNVIQRIISDYFYPDGNTSVRQKFENWDFEERQSKFIANSSQVYHYFKIKFLMPLFDRDLLVYFLGLPFEQRLDSALYNKTVEEQFFKIHGVGYDLKPAGTGLKEVRAKKENLIRILPHFLKKWYYPVKDDVCYREFTRELITKEPANRYAHPAKPHFYNGYLVQWYFNQLKGRIETTNC